MHTLSQGCANSRSWQGYIPVSSLESCLMTDVIMEDNVSKCFGHIFLAKSCQPMLFSQLLIPPNHSGPLISSQCSRVYILVASQLLADMESLLDITRGFRKNRKLLGWLFDLSAWCLPLCRSQFSRTHNENRRSCSETIYTAVTREGNTVLNK
jgi:hypothetical protein